MKKLVAVLGVVLVLLLGTCVYLSFMNAEQESEPAVFLVQFMVDGSIYKQVSIQDGNSLDDIGFIDGLRFAGWEDLQGNAVDPFAYPVTGDATYVAVYYPELSKHVPYLFVDENGNLRPDDILTAQELKDALQALAEENAIKYFPELPTGDETLTVGDLVEVLSDFYNSATVATVFADVDTLTRAAFAGGMNSLLARVEETVLLSQEDFIPTDVTMERTDAGVLLEASVAHTPSAEGIAWSSVSLPTALEPGFVNIDGWLYYVQDDHYFLRDAYFEQDGYRGLLYFDSNGRYTCGSQELDEIVAEKLNGFFAENPEATRFEILRIAFDYCHQNFKYLRKSPLSFGETGWEIERATNMFQTGKGNCYDFAAIFWALARGLGYEARAVSGTCTGTTQPHGWVIMAVDGEDYFFDPEWQYAYTERGVFDKDMFQIPMSKINYWTYKWTEE